VRKRLTKLVGGVFWVLDASWLARAGAVATLLWLALLAWAVARKVGLSTGSAATTTALMVIAAIGLVFNVWLGVHHTRTKRSSASPSDPPLPLETYAIERTAEDSTTPLALAALADARKHAQNLALAPDIQDWPIDRLTNAAARLEADAQACLDQYAPTSRMHIETGRLLYDPDHPPGSFQAAFRDRARYVANRLDAAIRELEGAARCTRVLSECESTGSLLVKEAEDLEPIGHLGLLDDLVRRCNVWEERVSDLLSDYGQREMLTEWTDPIRWHPGPTIITRDQLLRYLAAPMRERLDMLNEFRVRLSRDVGATAEPAAA
jgi:hypothetical protein